MKELEKTAYCGIYCTDCIRFRNAYSATAGKLKELLDSSEFHKYAEVKTSFGSEFEKYPEFMDVLEGLIDAQCEQTCRVGGGCSGVPCEIMKCAQLKNYEGCWQCEEIEGCDKFVFLEPRCGNMPKNNLKKISEAGMEDWAELRDRFYKWQR